MKTSKILSGVVICGALVWGGIHFAKSGQPNPPANPAAVGQQQQPVASQATAPQPEQAAPQEPEVSPAAPAPENEASEPQIAVSSEEQTPESAPIESAKIEFEETDVLAGTQQGIVEATLSGNGRERMSAQLRNNSPTPLRVRIPAGQVLEGGRNRVVVTRASVVELMPARSELVELSTAALHSANVIGEAAFRLSYHEEASIAAFLQWLANHGEIPVSAVQTAVLALTENLPVSAVAKFAPVNGAAGIVSTDAFRVETCDIIAALSALRDSGAKMDAIAMNTDSQLRIEAMIEPLSREAAKRYFGISEEREWEFWKQELLAGNPSTRHYALFGIARFYPDVALEMLPKWAREAQTHMVYRTAAVQALADTQRPAALPLLRQIAEEVGRESDLGKAALQAAAYLDKRLAETAERTQVAAFRANTKVSDF